MTMRTLHHLWLSPFSRKVRLVLAEKKLDVDLVAEPVWERRPALLALNPAGEVPVLVEPEGGPVVCDSAAICEYLEETYPETPLLPGNAAARAEIRRLVAWFDGKFQCEVTDRLVGEKVLKGLLRRGEPDSGAIRAGHVNLDHHLAYIDWLYARRNWLAGEVLTLADLAAAAHISALDYLGEVPWQRHGGAKEWYMRIKSRPSFRDLLADRDARFRPAPHYAELDFD